MDRPKTYIDALRVLARTIDSNRVVLIERNIEKAVERAERDLEVAIAARKRLEQNLRELEDDAAELAGRSDARSSLASPGAVGSESP